MFKDLNQTWNLDVFFPGGSESPDFAAFLDALEKDVKDLTQEIKAPVSGAKAWAARLDKIQNVSSRLTHASAFVSCLSAQNVHDKHARTVGGRVKQLSASYASVMTMLDQHILQVPDQEWQELLANDELKPLAYNLDERRRKFKEMLSPEQEMLVNSLSVDGYRGWSDLYDLTTGAMTITVEQNGKPVTLSPGQVANRMSGPDAKERAHMMEKWEEAWSQEAESCALALNHLAGYRINLYRHRGWDDVLKEPMSMNRMSIDTLNTMWATIDANKERLVAYLQRKRELLGLEKLGWQDISAPIGQSNSKLTYDQAAAFIVEQFSRFSPKMAEFATMAFNNRWIEAEDRPGKRMGGFCTGFPEKKQSRIFVTFSGTMGNMATVAHELGHGYHQSIMQDLPTMTRHYAMNVAETASTFAEMIVADAAVKYAPTKEEKLSLMEDKLQRAVALLMNIQARFLFETRFYAERKQGLVPVKRLNELMLQAQKDAFKDSLDLYHPHFWASKLHFYNTGVPFYNFPYTFGFLFSAGVYAKAMKVGPSFEEDYANLLRETGRMQVEDLAKRHLGV
ncbi:MAG: M3 family oligoendopeptidase, partial [Bacillota bacterium]